MELIGEIVDIIYKNEVNSYIVANLETETEVFTVVGYLPFINVGDNLKLEGKFVTHQEYGRQFKIETFEKIMPETLDALERYLANGNVKGIGPVTAHKIIKEFGEETISVDEIAKKANTINYEIICNINSRVTRVYMKNGKVESAFGYLLSE